jgi:hypothetical protein
MIPSLEDPLFEESLVQRKDPDAVVIHPLVTQNRYDKILNKNSASPGPNF